MEQAPTILTAVVKKACKGDAVAQAWLYEQYSKAMFNICIRMVSARADAEDLLQESFIIAFTKLHQLTQAEQFGGWLRRIVVNECIRYTKKKVRLQDWDSEHLTDIAEEETTWWETVDIPIIHQQIKSLPEGCRQVFSLFVSEDYSHNEIAAELGISVSTSKSQYHRAKQLLKERITKYNTLHG